MYFTVALNSYLHGRITYNIFNQADHRTLMLLWKSQKHWENPSKVNISSALLATEEGVATTFVCDFRQWSVLSYYCTISEVLQNVSPFHVMPVGKKIFWWENHCLSHCHEWSKWTRKNSVGWFELVTKVNGYRSAPSYCFIS